jgi:hypothetical protein
VYFNYIYIHTYHARFIPEGFAEASQIFLRDAHVLPKLVFEFEKIYSAEMIVGKPIAVYSQSILGVGTPRAVKKKSSKTFT